MRLIVAEIFAGPGVCVDDAVRRDDDVPRMADKTFDNILPKEGQTPEQAREAFLRSLYSATRSGVHKTGTEMAGMASDGNGFIHSIDQNASAGYTWTISSTSILEARLGWSHIVAGKEPPLVGGPSLQSLFGSSALSSR